MNAVGRSGGLRHSIRSSLLGASIGLVGGIWLQIAENKLVAVVPLLIALPALNAMIGDIASIITAHIADPEASTYTRKKLYKSLGIIVPFSATGVVIVSLFVAYLQQFEITLAFAVEYGLFIAGLFSVATLATIALSLAESKKLIIKQQNIDEILIPLASIIASVLTLIIVSIGLFYVLT